MFSEDTYYSPCLTISGMGRVLQQVNSLSQTTVSPADIVLTHPSHGPTQSSAIPHHVTSANQSVVGYSTVYDAPQGAPGCHRCRPPARVVQPVDHASGQFSIPNDAPAGHFTVPPMPVGRMSRGSSIRCEWISEDWSACGQMITEGATSKHLAVHGIRDMHKDRIVQCLWYGCWVHIKRQSITRHMREVHLGSKRKSHKHALPLPLALRPTFE